MDAAMKSVSNNLAGATSIDRVRAMPSIADDDEPGSAPERERLLVAALGRLDLPRGIGAKLSS